MIKSIGKIAGLPLGLIVVLGSATGVSAMRETPPQRTVITTKKQPTFGSTGGKISSQSTIKLISVRETSPETQTNTHLGNQSKLKGSSNTEEFGKKSSLNLNKNKLKVFESTSDEISSQQTKKLTSMRETSPETQTNTHLGNQSKLPVKSKPPKFGKSNISQFNNIDTHKGPTNTSYVNTIEQVANFTSWAGGNSDEGIKHSNAAIIDGTQKLIIKILKNNEYMKKQESSNNNP